MPTKTASDPAQSHSAQPFSTRRPRLARLLEKAARKASPQNVVVLDYPVNSKPRWTPAVPHPRLHAIIDAGRDAYRANLESFLPLADGYAAIFKRASDGATPIDPCWINDWMPALDGVALYGFLAVGNPRMLLEVGSGNSTKFAKRAIRDQSLQTKIVSIDPCPRAEIDAICDVVIRRPVEEVELSFFDRLESGDILYIDNSHRSFMNSDATMLLIDVLPRLKPGVIVEVHDIFLPHDYPEDWAGRYYSEQYLLAAYLLSEGDTFETILPNMFVTHDPELNTILNPLWERPELQGAPTHGCSYWLRKK